MYNQLLLSLAVSTVPILAFAFIGLLLLHKLYVKIRSKFNATVNCWFCNQNTRVPYLESNSWTCPHCEQYNGFTKDGDYNREIFQQKDCSSSSATLGRIDRTFEHDVSASTLSESKNGFCCECNEAQRLKVEKLAQFEPKIESRFDEELKVYKTKLEEQYRLCGTCDRHLRKVLHEKKKMVLGSKFLDFIIKGAETLKQPHFTQIRHFQRQHLKRRLSFHVTILTIVYLLCLLFMLPALTRGHLTTVFGDRLGEQLFTTISHVSALGRVFTSYLTRISEEPLIEKIKLFIRTIFMMLLYSLGLKMPQITRINFSSLYVLIYPFALLGMSFSYKIVDGFKLTRFTFLLALWSAFAGGFVEEQLYFPQTALMLFASMLTLVLSVTNEVDLSPRLHDANTSSFHKIYSEDYLSDEDTISMLSQQLNSSSASTVRSNSLGGRVSPPQRERLYKAPVTSSTLSLHNAPMSHFSPNSNYISCYLDPQSQLCSSRSQYAASNIGDFNTAFSSAALTSRASLFGSNWKINNNEQPRSNLFGTSSNHTASPNANISLQHASFSGEINAHQMKKQRNIFSQYSPVNSKNQRPFPANTTALHSPFSLSSNAAYQQNRPASTNLLTPSRFSTTCLASNTSASSLFPAGSFNLANKNFPETRKTVTAIGENLSRASSQSSGFESQNDWLNVSRENSLSSDGNDAMQQQRALDPTRGFQPIDTGSGLPYSPRPSLLSPPFETQLTVNCGMASPLIDRSHSEFWGAPTQRKSIGSRDIFNLRKINEELPLPTYKYKRGDLLKKWKDSQTVS